MKRISVLLVGVVVAFLFYGGEVVNAASNEDFTIVSSEIHDGNVEQIELSNGMSVSYDLETDTVLGVHTPGEFTNEELDTLELKAIEVVLIEKSEEYLKAKKEELNTLEMEIIETDILKNSPEFQRVLDLVELRTAEVRMRHVPINPATIGPFSSRVISLGNVGSGKRVTYFVEVASTREDQIPRTNGVKLTFSNANTNGWLHGDTVKPPHKNGNFTNYGSSKNIKLTLTNLDSYSYYTRGSMAVYL